jgi:hypothetical protein
VQGFARFDAGILLGSLLGVILLFSLPVTLLGCVSPFAIRLATQDVRSSGSVAGSVYALSTVGSIAGAYPVRCGCRTSCFMLSLDYHTEPLCLSCSAWLLAWSLALTTKS